ncbi:RuBisCO large subunit C-terminal-like domain-containing protein [Occultella aeris]|uniref:Ribulose bisphosphate carboxylase-like protein 2 n=1 Tax=Occultella aeris TaxID=2761496 RepID=A0A7M4DHY5_9MICO|nr:RuBisCO large subunit C-terminal-like domain-containing protein [Occultella aeris]VZO36532.1 Ribulose bisphosphate carboxylase-like protein 2 [Occultella aeris]
MSVVTAVYDIETALPLEQAAAVMASEQSSGTFVAVARETEDLKRRYAARVVGIEELPLSGRPPLPGASGDWSRARRARVSIEFPLHNFGPSIPNLLAAVAGNLFEIREAGALRLVDLDLPAAFAERYPGPAFGWDGTLALTGRERGPLLGTIVKPSIGLSADQLGELVTELADAGIDFIKDDELQGNAPNLPLAERVRVVTDALHRAADRNGRMPMYAFNITDDIDRLAANHDLVEAAGGTCVMICVNTVGLAGLQYLRAHSELPIHGHRTMFGAYSRSPQVGIDFMVFQKLSRLAGSDHVHTNGLSNKFYESDEQVLASIAAVRAPLLGGYEAVPVLSSGQTAALATRTYEQVGTDRLLVLAGGGIHGHPGGSAAGVRAMREAWSAALTGEALEERAASVPELAAALAAFGPPR